MISNYYLDGSKILGEEWLDENGENHKIDYFYNAEGIAGIRYDNHNFNFVKDGFGNISKVMHRGKLIAEYNYDAWGNCTIQYLGTTPPRDIFVVENNPFRWKSHYCDLETGMYYTNGGYYSPELMQYLNAKDVSELVQTSINGSNLFSYATNNPVVVNALTESIAKVYGVSKVAGIVNSSGAGGMSSMASVNGINNTKSRFVLANSIFKTHFTETVAQFSNNVFIGRVFGNIVLSTTISSQNKESGLFYSFTDVGNDNTSYGAGLNVLGWIGLNGSIQSDGNYAINAQITPWVHGGVQLGLDGVGVNLGIDIGNTSYDISANVGLGTLAVAAIVIFAPASIPALATTAFILVVTGGYK